MKVSYCEEDVQRNIIRAEQEGQVLWPPFPSNSEPTLVLGGLGSQQVSTPLLIGHAAAPREPPPPPPPTHTPQQSPWALWGRCLTEGRASL